MRHLRDPENICAAVLIGAFFLPWIRILMVLEVSGHRLHRVVEVWGVVWAIPVLSALIILLRISDLPTTGLSIFTGLLPLAGLLYLLSEFGSTVFQGLQIGGWLTLLAGLGLMAAALGRRTQKAATREANLATGTEGTQS